MSCNVSCVSISCVSYWLYYMKIKVYNIRKKNNTKETNKKKILENLWQCRKYRDWPEKFVQHRGVNLWDRAYPWHLPCLWEIRLSNTVIDDKSKKAYNYLMYHLSKLDRKFVGFGRRVCPLTTSPYDTSLSWKADSVSLGSCTKRSDRQSFSSVLPGTVPCSASAKDLWVGQGLSAKASGWVSGCRVLYARPLLACWERVPASWKIRAQGR